MSNYTYKIKDVKPLNVQVDNSNLLEVTLDLFKDEEVLGERKFGYPLEVTKEEIEADLEKQMASLANDDEIAESSAALQRGLDNVEAIKSQLLPKEQ